MKKLIGTFVFDEHTSIVKRMFIAHCPTCDPTELMPSRHLTEAERSMWTTAHVNQTNHHVYYRTEIQVFANGA